MIIQSKEITLVPLKKLKAKKNNRNKHPQAQIEMLAKHLKYQGFRNPIIVSNQTGEIVCGHGRFEAAKMAGFKEVPVIYQDFESTDQEYSYHVADNGLSLWSELDLSGINNDLQNLGPDFDIDLLGIRGFILEPAEKLKPQCDEDELPEKVEPKTKLGDLYKLGNHRLLCGDSTNIQHVENLMDGKTADITFTSPPYNNAGRTPNGNKQKYLNDSDNKETKDYVNLLKDFTSLCISFSDYVFVNIQSLSGNKIGLIEYLHEMKEVYADTIIWDKINAEPAMAKNCLNSQYEYIHIFSQKANRIIGKKEFRGTISNVFQFSSKKDKDFSKVHKATFPVSFAEYFIDNFSLESVMDPFGGTGTTMIAAEKLGKKSYLMELDPYYCDVIVARWEKYTGQKAELING